MVKHINRQKDSPGEKDLLAIFLGRSNTLRAPVLSRGSWIIAGFDEGTYKNLLKIDSR